MRTALPVRGELDLVTSAAFSRELLAFAASTEGDVEIDCSELTFIDSSGLRAFVSLAQELATQGRRLRLLHLQPVCRRAIEVSALSNILGVAPR